MSNTRREAEAARVSESFGARNLARCHLFIVSVNLAEPVPAELAALIVTLKVPAPPGLPEMTPVVWLTESPAGRPVALKLVGLLLAVIW